MIQEKNHNWIRNTVPVLFTFQFLYVSSSSYATQATDKLNKTKVIEAVKENFQKQKSEETDLPLANFKSSKKKKVTKIHEKIQNQTKVPDLSFSNFINDPSKKLSPGTLLLLTKSKIKIQEKNIYRRNLKPQRENDVSLEGEQMVLQNSKSTKKEVVNNTLQKDQEEIKRRLLDSKKIEGIKNVQNNSCVCENEATSFAKDKGY